MNPVWHTLEFNAVANVTVKRKVGVLVRLVVVSNVNRFESSIYTDDACIQIILFRKGVESWNVWQNDIVFLDPASPILLSALSYLSTHLFHHPSFMEHLSFWSSCFFIPSVFLPLQSFCRTRLLGVSVFLQRLFFCSTHFWGALGFFFWLHLAFWIIGLYAIPVLLMLPRFPFLHIFSSS